MPPDANAAQIVAMDDDPLTLRLLEAHLRGAGYTISAAGSGVDGLELIGDRTAVALVDLRMRDLSGIQVLQHLQRNHPTVHVIMLTGSDDLAVAVQAMREGAFQFLTKPFDPDELVVYVDKAIQSWLVEYENRDLKESHSQSIPVRMVESSGDMHSRLMQQVNRLAALDSTVFIGGESGTGKSTVARMIHQKSQRSGGPFVTVNCASLPRDLIQSELFGHTKGAFTGAEKDRIGHAELAHQGTLFLDEIGDLPLDLQPKLLTFLQDRTVQRLGGEAPRIVDVRLIAATHRDLAEMCRSGLFRQDLYFRLMVLSLELPALRFRTGELASIATGILQGICTRQSMRQLAISDRAMRALLAHPWPGNIRELENVLERAVAFCAGPEIEPEDLQFSTVFANPSPFGFLSQGNAVHPVTEPWGHPVTEPWGGHGVPRPAADRPMPPLSALLDNARPGSPSPNSSEMEQPYCLVGKTLEEIERDAILQTLSWCGGNKAKTARTLGISEKTVYNKMRRLKIQG